jgi:hypothetical protein
MSERDHIQFNYRPKIKAAAQLWLDNEEVPAVIAIASGNNIDDDLYNYYADVFEKLLAAFGVLSAYQGWISKATIRELGGKSWLSKFDVGGQLDSFIATFKKEFLETFAIRYLKSSYGQLLSLIDDGPEALITWAEQWQQRRAAKVSRNEATRGNQSIFMQIAHYSGFSVVWHERGKSCPYCMKLDGRRISSGQAFLQKGDVLDPDDPAHPPMRIYGRIQHPPAHFA